jgi:hypothetical protein
MAARPGRTHCSVRWLGTLVFPLNVVANARLTKVMSAEATATLPCLGSLAGPDHRVTRFSVPVAVMDVMDMGVTMNDSLVAMPV